MKKDHVPIEISLEIVDRVEAFNEKYLTNEACSYCTVVRGKYVCFMYTSQHKRYEPVCRVTYDGDLENMNFALYNHSTKDYDYNACLFPGEEYVDGTIEGALMAGMMAHPIIRGVFS